MDEAAALRALWERFEARDWDGAGALLAEDVVLEWPQTRERLRGRANVLAMNQAYPEGWRIEVEEVWPAGPGRAVSRVRVPFQGSVEWCCSFATFRGGRIAHLVETWAPAQPAPAWRARWVEPMP
jgi:ketosteroid isomerase-like protein